LQLENFSKPEHAAYIDEDSKREDHSVEDTGQSDLKRKTIRGEQRVALF